MVESTSSIVLNGGANSSSEASNANSSPHSVPLSKRTRFSKRSSKEKFKGIVLQKNGHWGAQIYAKKRVWLGTFKTEKEAAMAYDSAAIRLRSRDSHRNFPWTKDTVDEPKFQDHYTTEIVLNMIKDGSYQAKFADFLRTSHSDDSEAEACGLNLTRVGSKGGVLFKELFQKELTPSDVSKLNRLVIPKKYALKYFSHISHETAYQEGAGDHQDGATMDGLQLVFYDKMMRSWKFRYCYWRSSQSFVFTRGWIRFVKEKRLKVNDTVIFYMCTCREGGVPTKEDARARAFFVIDVKRVEDDSGSVGGAKNMCLNKMHSLHLNLRLRQEVRTHEEEEEEVLMETEPIPGAENSGFRLFGVQII